MSLGPDGMKSGLGDCQNNPSNECQNRKKGPIPEGDYDILPYDGRHSDSDNWWRLRSDSIIQRGWDRFGWGRGGGYLLHPGHASWGCLTYEKGNDDSYKALNNLLRREDGNNKLHILP